MKRLLGCSFGILDLTAQENLGEKSVYYSVYANLIGGCSVFLEEEEFDYDEDEEEFPEVED